MNMPKFSIIMPVYSEFTPQLEGASGHLHNRAKMVQRAIKSVINQQFPDWELILVNDGCADEITPKIMQKFVDQDDRIKLIHQENQNRAIARNTGMDAATGEWLCWLDSDDEYSTHYLRELHQASLDFPEYKIFNFGSIIHWPDHHTGLRQVFTPKEEGEGHEYFRSGHIGCGSFIFKRTLREGKSDYRIPDEVNPYEFAAASRFDMRFTPDNPDYQYIENPDEAFTDGVYRHGLSLGNPWGDDFLQFYRLTRDNHSKPLDVLLYIQYPRAHEEVYEHFGEIYDTE
jgi:glycosyltransferase involved in cell wall biosynthesis